MKNRKWSKLLVVMLTLAMCVWTLSACGGNSGSSEEQPAEEPAAEAAEGYTNAEVSSDLSMADEVKAYYDAIDMEYAYNLSEELAYNWDDYADFLGWRSSGSDSEHATADYLAAQMEELGLKNVDKVATTCDKFQFNSSSLKIADTDISYDSEEQSVVEDGLCAPASYQVNGTDGDLTAEIVDCGTGTEAEYDGKDVKGKIVLVQVDQSNESWIDGYMRMAAEKEAAALVTWANSGYGEAGKFTINVQDVCCADLLPTVAISAKQAKQIKAAIKDGKTECTLNVDAEMADNGGTTYNVCGMIPGKNHDQKIIVSGHYDKYWYGFQDDCAAIGLVFGVAKAMLDSGYEPENDIYFVCHGAEEWGVTDSMFDWTTGAWGMVDDKGMADGVIAMLNCELPAFEEPDQMMQVASVPEFYTLVGSMFDSGLVVTAGDKAFSTDPQATTTMEDGISYREYGAPYFLNGFENTAFMCQNYHTIADSKETYSENVFRTNLNWYGAYAIYIDTEPALELDMTQTAKQLKDDFNADYAEEAGVDTEKYLAAVDELNAAGEALNKEIADCNAAYEEAVAGEDEEAAAKAREDGQALNEKSLEAFQAIQDAFLKVTDFGADYGHTPENTNVKALDGVLAGLENGEIWAEDEESGAADCAWTLNSAAEYNYCIFSKSGGDTSIDAHTDEYYTGGKDHAQWGWNHQPTVTNTGDLSYELLHAETIDDIEDVDAMKEGYKAARDEQIKAIGKWSNQEIDDMTKIAEMLK